MGVSGTPPPVGGVEVEFDRWRVQPKGAGDENARGERGRGLGGKTKQESNIRKRLLIIWGMFKVLLRGICACALESNVPPWTFITKVICFGITGFLF